MSQSEYSECEWREWQTTVILWIQKANKSFQFYLLQQTKLREIMFHFWLWLLTFENFLVALPQEELNKLRVLINYVSPDVYELIGEAKTYEEAINTLKTLYVKTPNEIFARHSLATQK